MLMGVDTMWKRIMGFKSESFLNGGLVSVIS